MKFRVALFRLKLERAWWRFARAAVVLFLMPGRILDLPEGDPRRFLAAQAVLYILAGVVIVAMVLR